MFARVRKLFAGFGSRAGREESISPPSENEGKSPDGEKIRRLRRRLEEKNLELERLQSELTRNVVRSPNMSLDETPVFFLVGRAKSGTSWLMRILDAHPEILCKGEGRFFGRDFIQENFERGQKGRIQPSSLYRALLEAEYLEAWIERSVWTRRDGLEEHMINLTRLCTDYFLTQRLLKSGKRIVGDKTPFLGDAILEEIGRIHSDARVIHIIRDGRDIAVSLIHHRWNLAKDEGGIYELTPEELAKREAYRRDAGELLKTGEGLFAREMLRGMAVGWRNQIVEARKDGHKLLGANYMEVRYEDLLERTEAEVRRLLNFLGADAGEEVVKECVGSASFQKLTEGRERGQEDPSSFFRKGVAGDWKDVFTEQDRQVFKEEAGDLLIELGYERDHNW